MLELLLVRLAEVVLAQKDRHRGVLLSQAELRATQRGQADGLTVVKDLAGLGVAAEETYEGLLADSEPGCALFGGALDPAKAAKGLKRFWVGI